MTEQERLNRALQIRAALEVMMTPTEAENYDCLFEHFSDYINDLTIDLQNTLDDL